MPGLDRKTKPGLSLRRMINVVIVGAILFNVIVLFAGLQSFNASNHTTQQGRNIDVSGLDLLDFQCKGTPPTNKYGLERKDAAYNTLKCPWGPRTSQNYTQSLMRWYNISSLDKDVFRRCADLTLPLRDSDPNECFPRFIILASYPTSGNALCRDLLDGVVDRLDLSMSMYPETGVDEKIKKILKEKGREEVEKEMTKKNGNLMFNLPRFDAETTTTRHEMEKRQMKKHETKPNIKSFQIFGSFKTTTAIPFMKLPVVFKSHICNGCSAEEQIHTLAYLTKLHNDDKFHGVIRMARNPEQILRDKHRWNASTQCKGVSKVKEDCFAKTAINYCSDLTEFSVGYTQFHSFWNKLDHRIPQMIVHYEHLTSKEYVQEEMQKILKLLDDITPEMNFMQFDKEGVIVETEYNHGSLVAKVCGKEVARELHEATKSVSEPLGYVFNSESGTWSLSKE